METVLGLEKKFAYDIFLICPVRGTDEKDLKEIEKYVSSKEKIGKIIYYPAKDTNQIDSLGGYKIWTSNCIAMQNSVEVHVYWTQKSEGSKLDLGMAFLLHQTTGKKIILANRNDVEKIVSWQKKEEIKKSFEMTLLKLDDLAQR